MRVLIVSATAEEISFFSQVILNAKEGRAFALPIKKQELQVLISGVGMMRTAFYLGNILAQQKFDLAINLGLAGALERNLQLGEVVEVITDSFADVGAEDDQGFIDDFDLGLSARDKFPFQNKKINNVNQYTPLARVKQVEAITVNKVHGNESSIAALRNRTHAAIETMEGAAFFYACMQNDIPCMQLRSISNYVEKRDKSKWNIPLAIQNLQAVTENFLGRILK